MTAPFLISWNITKRCNLRCAHCYLDSSELDGPDETDRGESLRFIDEVSELNPSSMLILTGGEPLLRPDFFDIAGYAARKGLAVVVGTNGTLVDERVSRRLKEAGVRGVGVSIDSSTPSYHDGFRGVKGSWSASMNAVQALQRAGVDFHVQFTVTRENRGELPGMLDLASRAGARALNVFFLVCTGRGEKLTDLDREEYESTLRYLAECQERFGGEIMVRARCAPHFSRVASSGSFPYASGCVAGRGYLRISPEGSVTPCPYIPATPASPNLKTVRLREAIETDPLFLSLGEALFRGRCGPCEFKDSCGGCRARALAASGDLLGEDPFCSYEPGSRPAHGKPLWTEDALARLDRAPAFVRAFLKRGVESYAQARGIKEITPELLQDLKRSKASIGENGRGNKGQKRG